MSDNTDTKPKPNKRKSGKKVVMIVMLTVVMITAVALLIVNDEITTEQERFTGCAALIDSSNIKAGTIQSLLNHCLLKGEASTQKQIDLMGLTFNP